MFSEKKRKTLWLREELIEEAKDLRFKLKAETVNEVFERALEIGFTELEYRRKLKKL